MNTPMQGFYTLSERSCHSYDFYPAQAPAAPLFIWVHGGAWRFGDKSSFGYSENGQHALRTRLLQRGFAVASINYRFSDQCIFPAQINDVKTAIRYFRKNATKFGVDPNRMIVGGGSAGGHLALLAAGTAELQEPYYEGLPPAHIETAVSSRVLCAVSFYGVSDLRTIFTDRPLCGVALEHPEDDGAEWRLLGSSYPAPAGGTAELNWELAHPIERARVASAVGKNHHAPTYLVHGTADGCVPYVQSQRVFEALQSNNIESRLVLVEGADHSDSLCYTESVIAPLVAWLQKQILGAR